MPSEKVVMTSYWCKFPGCEILIPESEKMVRIVFGIHPEAGRQIDEKEGKVVEIRKPFYFCQQHGLILKEELVLLLATLGIDEIKNRAKLLPGYGCWATIHDDFMPSPKNNIWNFQVDYRNYVKVYTGFTDFLAQRQKMYEVEVIGMHSTVNL